MCVQALQPGTKQWRQLRETALDDARDAYMSRSALYDPQTGVLQADLLDICDARCVRRAPRVHAPLDGQFPAFASVPQVSRVSDTAALSNSAAVAALHSSAAATRGRAEPAANSAAASALATKRAALANGTIRTETALRTNGADAAAVPSTSAACNSKIAAIPALVEEVAVGDNAMLELEAALAGSTPRSAPVDLAHTGADAAAPAKRAAPGGGKGGGAAGKRRKHAQ